MRRSPPPGRRGRRPERVVASTDCGFGTFVGFARVGAQVAEMELRAMAEGAALVRA